MKFDGVGLSLDLGTIETIFAILASGGVMLGALYVMVRNIMAASYSKPVVDAKMEKAKEDLENAKDDISKLTRQNTEQQGIIDNLGSQIGSLRELVTHAAEVGALREENGAEHKAIIATLERLLTNISIMNRMLIAVATKVGVEVRKNDGDQET